MLSNIEEGTYKLEKEKMHRNTALYWNEMANSRLFDLHRQLIGLAVILIPLSSYVVLLPAGILDYEKLLLLIAWLYLLISLLAGFYQMLIDTRYFAYLSADSSRREWEWSRQNLTKDEVIMNEEKLGQTSSSSTHLPFILQSIFLIMGLIFLLSLGVSILIRQ